MEAVAADTLFRFLTDLKQTAEAQRDFEAAEALSQARKHYIFPLTSEFMGESMLALENLVARGPAWLSREQTNQAKVYVDSIRRRWFSQHD